MTQTKTSPTRQKPQIKIFNDWLRHLEGEFDKDYMKNLRQFLKKEQQKEKEIFPPSDEVFEALNKTDFDEVKVVILGQDPYHGPGQAHGLAFSVREGVKMPPSLKNIFKEIKNDLGKEIPESGDLSHWAEQGVLLLNATLTVEAQKAGSHQKKGWEDFTDKIIKVLNEKKENLVFLLWGSYAQKKGDFIDDSKHLILKAPHPSPLSSHRGFFGCNHFSKTNEFLKSKGMKPIDW